MERSCLQSPRESSTSRPQIGGVQLCPVRGASCGSQSPRVEQRQVDHLLVDAHRLAGVGLELFEAGAQSAWAHLTQEQHARSESILAANRGWGYGVCIITLRRVTC